MTSPLSLTVPPSSVNLPNLTRVDSVFSLAFYRCVNRSLALYTSCCTSRSFKNSPKEALIRPIGPQLSDGVDAGRGLTVNWVTWLSMDRCWDSYNTPVNSAWSVVPDDANLVKKDCLSKFFDELDDRSGIFPFIEDPGTLAFVQYHLGSFLDSL